MSRSFTISAALVVMVGLGVYAISGPQNAQMIADVQKAMGMDTCSYKTDASATMASTKSDSCCPAEGETASTVMASVATDETATCSVDSTCSEDKTVAASYTCPISGETVMASVVADESATCSLVEKAYNASAKEVAVAESCCESTCSETSDAVATSTVEVANAQ